MDELSKLKEEVERQKMIVSELVQLIFKVKRSPQKKAHDIINEFISERKGE
jgi:GH35 family endo-1,4-beta-xylanase